MLVQITKILEGSTWNSPEDKEFFEGKVFYIPEKKDHISIIDRSWKKEEPINFLLNAELLSHKDLSRVTIPLYSFGYIEFKILTL